MWFKKFGDPDFVYEQQMARVYGLQMLRMASADVLPYDYENYGKEILVYIDAAMNKSKERFGDKSPNFSAALEAARHLQEAGAKMLQKQRKIPGTPEPMNAKLRGAERALLIPEGLPNRPWYRHSIYAPGQYTGYAAVVIPGINEAIDRGDRTQTEQQIAVLAGTLNRAVMTLEQYR
jgi:N-acetylated-alpha-linked acidic dipeptidase